MRWPSPLGVFATLVLVFLTAPTLLIVPMSFSGSPYLEFPPPDWSIQWHLQYLESREWVAATWVSLRVAVWTALVSLGVGTMAAYGLHIGEFRRGNLLYALLMTPIIFPIILLAVGSFYMYSKVGLLHSELALVLSHACLAIPIVIIFMRAAFRSYDFDQERAAQTLGASRLVAFFTVTLPQIKFSLLSAGLFTFLISFDEVVIAIFIAGGDSTTLTKKMFNSLRDIMDPTVAAISTWILVVTCVILFVAQFVGKKAEGSD